MKYTTGYSLAHKLDHYSARDTKTGCRLWSGAINDTGYGQIKINNVTKYAHRLSWELINGPIPPGLYICHKCDVRRCINPNHLFLGTPKDNMQDAVKKGRVARGERSGPAKLTEKQVLAIRKDKRVGRVVGADYGVGRNCIEQIRHGRTWSHLN